MTGLRLSDGQRRRLVGLDVGAHAGAGECCGHGPEVVVQGVGVDDQGRRDELAHVHRTGA